MRLFTATCVEENATRLSEIGSADPAHQISFRNYLYGTQPISSHSLSASLLPFVDLCIKTGVSNHFIFCSVTILTHALTFEEFLCLLH